MILDIIGYLLADGRQLKHLILDDRIVGLLGKLPIPQIVRPNPWPHNTDGLGVVTTLCGYCA
jgi:hypothetical protein